MDRHPNPPTVQEQQISPSTATIISKWFAERYAIRALIQCIPVVGGPLDTLSAGIGIKYEQQRIESLLQSISERLDQIPDVFKATLSEPSEELFDFFSDLFRKVALTRSETKRQHYANICVNHLTLSLDWDAADECLRLVHDLTEKHLSILVFATNVPIAPAPFNDHRAFTCESADANLENSALQALPSLTTHLKGIHKAFLTHYCADLVGKGLLRDEGVHRIGLGPMAVFEATPVADWFIHWIEDDRS